MSLTFWDWIILLSGETKHLNAISHIDHLHEEDYSICSKFLCIYLLHISKIHLFVLKVLQGGGLESPTKPKGRPKKNSIPSSEQLSEQEKAKEVEKQMEELHSPCEVNQEE